MNSLTTIAAVCCLAVGCSFPTRPMLLKLEPFTGDPATAWHRFETADFTLFTDLPRGQAEEAAQAIAGELAAVRAGLGNLPERPGRPLDIVIYANGKDFEDRFGRTVGAASRLGDDASHLSVFLWGTPARWVRMNMVGQGVSDSSALRQLLTHATLARAIDARTLPHWLAFGLGTYLETLAWADDGSGIETGAVNGKMRALYRRDRAVGFEDVTGPPRPHPGNEQAWQRGYEGYCWAVVFTLATQHPAALSGYLAALTRGEQPDPHSLFDGQSSEAIDTEVQRFIKLPSISFHRLAVHSEVQTAHVTTVTDAELAAVSPPLQPIGFQ